MDYITKKLNIITLIASLSIVIYACESNSNDDMMTPTSDTCTEMADVTFTSSVLPILQANCQNCHGGSNEQGNFNYDNYCTTLSFAKNGKLSGSVNHTSGFSSMPKDQNQLSVEDLKVIDNWVASIEGGTTSPSYTDVSCTETADAIFTSSIKPLLQANCQQCHSGDNKQGNFNYDDFCNVKEFAINGKLSGAINHSDGFSNMPKNSDKLSDETLKIIDTWIMSIEGGKTSPSYSDCNTEGQTITYDGFIKGLLDNHCVGCHSGSNPAGGIGLSDYTNVKQIGENGKLYGAINHDAGFKPMPRNNPKLADCDIKKVKMWVDNNFVEK